MEVKINNNGILVDATIEMVDGVMVVSPKVEKFEPIDRTDWQQVRIQAAIAAMQGILANQSSVVVRDEIVIRESVSLADALVKELKGE